MHDFNCTTAADMLSPILADEVQYYKETERGKQHMPRLMDQVREEAAKEATREAERMFATLTKILIRQNRLADLDRAADDEEYRKSLYQELNIISA